MFVFDVETLGVESTTVVLSAALVYFDPEKQPSYQDLLDDALFVKFKAKEQVDAGRTVSKSTLQWWKDQHEYVRKMALEPSVDDVSVAEGFKLLHSYMDKYDPDRKHTIWARGSLDQMAIDSLAVAFDIEEISGYNVWRDVRTAVDCFTGSTNGYCNVEHPTFKRHEVIKHHPVHDCALDAMMLMYGK
jgi:hypothetical protein